MDGNGSKNKYLKYLIQGGIISASSSLATIGFFLAKAEPDEAGPAIGVMTLGVILTAGSIFVFAKNLIQNCNKTTGENAPLVLAEEGNIRPQYSQEQSQDQSKVITPFASRASQPEDASLSVDYNYNSKGRDNP